MKHQKREDRAGVFDFSHTCRATLAMARLLFYGGGGGGGGSIPYLTQRL